jgi:hypothetical protein
MTKKPVVRIRDEMKKVLGRVRREGYCNFPVTNSRGALVLTLND